MSGWFFDWFVAFHYFCLVLLRLTLDCQADCSVFFCLNFQSSSCLIVKLIKFQCEDRLITPFFLEIKSALSHVDWLIVWFFNEFLIYFVFNWLIDWLFGRLLLMIFLFILCQFAWSIDAWIVLSFFRSIDWLIDQHLFYPETVMDLWSRSPFINLNYRCLFSVLDSSPGRQPREAAQQRLGE